MENIQFKNDVGYKREKLISARSLFFKVYTYVFIEVVCDANRFPTGLTSGSISKLGLDS